MTQLFFNSNSTQTSWNSLNDTEQLFSDQTGLSGVQSKSNRSLLQAEVMTMKGLCNELKHMTETLDSQSLC